MELMGRGALPIGECSGRAWVQRPSHESLMSLGFEDSAREPSTEVAASLLGFVDPRRLETLHSRVQKSSSLT